MNYKKATKFLHPKPKVKKPKYKRTDKRHRRIGHPMSEETKAKLMAGQVKARAEKKAMKAAEPKPEVVQAPMVLQEVEKDKSEMRAPQIKTPPPNKKLPSKEQVIAQNKIAFWAPWPHQQRILDLLHLGKKVLLLQGANRVGKSCLAANIAGACAFGFQPWDLKPVDHLFGKPPTRTRIIGIDWEHHIKEVLIPSLKEWLPVGSYETKKNHEGVEAGWTFQNGSTIEILTHSQETKIHEGWEGNLVIADEPLPRDKYVANRRGLVDRSGIFLMTMTALYEAWIMDEIALSTEPHIGCVTEIPMRANPLLKQVDIDNYEKDVPEEEKEARIKGGWWQLAGKILKGFDKEKHGVKNFLVPTDWPIVAMIDIHLNIPQAVGFYGFDIYDRIFTVDEIWENLSPEDLGHAIVRKKKENSWRMPDAFIDPLSKGDSAYVKNRYGEVEDTFTILEKILAPEGITLQVASKDKESGIRNLEARLAGPNGMPTLFFMDKCDRHKYEIMRWVYRNGIPDKKGSDHMMENLYRVTLTGIKYSRPGIFTEELNYPKEIGIV